MHPHHPAGPRESLSIEHTAWLSYDSVAETYERVAVRWFEPMVRDLVDAVELSRARRVLDVGTGTGLAADLARSQLGSRVLAIGVDPSIAMLRLARSLRRIVTAVARAPGLPFADGTFDAALAALVISHLRQLDSGLGDMVRVLRTGGRLGVTAWAPDPDAPESQVPEADEIVAKVREACGLPSVTPVRGAPWEEELRDRGSLVSHLKGAGLLHVDARPHTYRHVFTIGDYLAGWGGLGRYLRWHGGEQRWRDFSRQSAERLQERFGTTVVSVTQVWVATGSAP